MSDHIITITCGKCGSDQISLLRDFEDDEGAYHDHDVLYCRACHVVVEIGEPKAKEV